MKQVVIISHEYDMNIYEEDNPKADSVLVFDLRPYDDSLPDKNELEELRDEIDSIRIPEAKEWMEQWYAENYTDWDAYYAEQAEKSNQRKKREEEEAKALLEKRGYKIVGG